MRYQRLDKNDKMSPFTLINYNFLHTHPLKPSESFPVLYNKICDDKQKTYVFSDSE